MRSVELERGCSGDAAGPQQAIGWLVAGGGAAAWERAQRGGFGRSRGRVGAGRRRGEPAPSSRATMVWMGTVWPSAILISFRDAAAKPPPTAPTQHQDHPLQPNQSIDNPRQPPTGRWRLESSKRGSSRSDLVAGLLAIVMVPSKMLSPIWVHDDIKLPWVDCSPSPDKRL